MPHRAVASPLRMMVCTERAPALPVVATRSSQSDPTQDAHDVAAKKPVKKATPKTAAPSEAPAKKFVADEEEAPRKAVAAAKPSVALDPEDADFDEEMADGDDDDLELEDEMDEDDVQEDLDLDDDESNGLIDKSDDLLDDHDDYRHH